MKTKNEDNEWFRWCHIRELNPVNKDVWRTKKSDKKWFHQEDSEFPVSRKSYHQAETKNKVSINALEYEMRKYIQFIDQKRVLKNHMELFLLGNEDR